GWPRRSRRGGRRSSTSVASTTCGSTSSSLPAMAEAIFWGAIGLVVYVYVGFPLLVWALSVLHPRPVRKAPARPPGVRSIIAAYTEERSIAKKLATPFGLDSPADRLEIVVVSDGSGDRTEEVVRAEGRGRVKLLALGSRNGKTIAQNRAVEAATGEILVFSDATTVYEPRTVPALVSNFSDPAVGGATSRGGVEAS